MIRMAMTAEEKKQYYREYYQANKDRYRENARRYYHSDKRYMKKYNHIRYMNHKAERYAQVQAYRKNNRKQYATEQSCIMRARRAAGLSREDVAERIGRSERTIALYETGDLPAPWEVLMKVIPGLMEVRNNV